MEKLVVLLFSAHFIADFLLQTGSFVRKKRQPLYLIAHALIQSIITYLIIQYWTVWQLPLAVLLAHGVIDAFKQYKGNDSAAVFIIDQAFHLLTLYIAAWIITTYSLIPEFTGFGYQFIVIAAGFTVTIIGLNHLLVKILTEIFGSAGKTAEDESEKQQWIISLLERAMIIVLILTGHPWYILLVAMVKALYFLIHLKGHIRLKYMIWSTTINFAMAIFCSLLCRWALTF